MTLLPVHMRNMVHLYEKGSKTKVSGEMQQDEDNTQDVVNISTEAKRKRILEQVKETIIHRIRETK